MLGSVPHSRQLHVPSLQNTRTCRRQQQILAAVKKGTGKSVVFSKTLTARKGEEKRVLKRCRDITDFSQGKMSNRENGIQAFECSQDRFEPNVFHFWERYNSNVNMGRHNSTPEMQTFMSEVGADCTTACEWPVHMWIFEFSGQQILRLRFLVQVRPSLDKPLGMALYEWKNGKIGAAAIQGGMAGLATAQPD